MPKQFLHLCGSMNRKKRGGRRGHVPPRGSSVFHHVIHHVIHHVGGYSFICSFQLLYGNGSLNFISVVGLLSISCLLPFLFYVNCFLDFFFFWWILNRSLYFSSSKVV